MTGHSASSTASRDDDLDPVLLDRYWLGEASPEERAAVDAWFFAHPEWSARYEQLRRGLQAGRTIPVPTARANATIANVLERTGARSIAGLSGTARNRREQTQVGVRRGLQLRHIALAVGAAAMVLLGITVVRESHAPERVAHYQTKPGQRLTVRLTDGSTMLLAPATSVTASASAIDVVGQAYFTVAPQTSRAWVVRTRNAVVQVLGTRFLVRQYDDETASRVVVEDGRVALHTTKQDATAHDRADRRTVLAAGMIAEVTDSGVTLTSGGATRELTGWVQGTLIFNRVPLRDVVSEVGRVYGVTIRVADSVLAAEPVVAEVDVTRKSLVQVLNVLGETMSAHYVEDRGAFVFVPGRRAVNERFEKVPLRQFPEPEKQYGR